MFSPTLPILLASAFIPVFTTTAAPPPIALHQSDYTFCYDYRYASFGPNPGDCADIINHQVARDPALRVPRTFSRDPNPDQFPLPYTWTTEKQLCNVTIDIPELPGRIHSVTADASRDQITQAAFDVMIACVLRDTRLGGLTSTGMRGHLFVRVEAGARSGGGRVRVDEVF
ncbi:MAG: hypothetical protein L6R41_006397 [Letrouitia leprolyta]|nr:MAG: hypothetical protein L6R41_006397 [Letrouitia leprolyta]